MTEEFNLTKNHIKLLRNVNISWGHIEFGAPCIDGKRPYGNGDVTNDIISLLFGDDLPSEAKKALEDYAIQLHKETELALQIILVTGSFKPGKYVQTRNYDYKSWKLKEQS